MTLLIELPDNLEAALRAQAHAKGISEEGYIHHVLEGDLAPSFPEEADAGRAEALQGSERAVERIRELRKGNVLPEGLAVRDLIDQGRA